MAKTYQYAQGSFCKDKDDDMSIVDPAWETIDPTPDLYSLFVVFDKKFFWSKLQSVEVKWSKRMTSCAGNCSYHPRGGACVISLSEPLLKLRPRKDFVETLLHEMIHAFLFVTHNDRDRDGHGPRFCEHMNRINRQAGTKISIYHSFHDEVNLYLVHWWRCNGPCQNWKPFYGFVKRSMNRAPGPNDRWWSRHQQHCNGTFIKVQEPEKAIKQKKGSNTISQIADIRSYFKNKDNQTNEKNEPSCSSKKPESTFVPFTGAGHKLDQNQEKSPHSIEEEVRNVWANKYPRKRPLEAKIDEEIEAKKQSVVVIDEENDFIPKTCFICNMTIEDDLNTHLEICASIFDEKIDENDAIGINDSKINDEDVTIVEKPLEVIDLVDQDESNCDTNEKNDGLVDCPCCPLRIRIEEINEHLDVCMMENE